MAFRRGAAEVWGGIGQAEMKWSAENGHSRRTRLGKVDSTIYDLTAAGRHWDTREPVGIH